MLIRILGRGRLARPIAGLAEHAGHVVRWSEQPAPGTSDGKQPDLVILAGSRAEIEADHANAVAETPRRLVVVDAIVPDDASSEAAPSIEAESEWIGTLYPEPRVVRAFASVPAQAFTDLLHPSSPNETTKLSVPLAGDDRDAKTLVERLMRDMGVEPFDLGALGAAVALQPGSPLWGKALSPLEMGEAEGWLSGDG
jgi:predicted dinucleotide-binding enzyme